MINIQIHNTGNIYINQDDFDYSFIDSYNQRKIANMIISRAYEEFNLDKASRLAQCWDYIKIAHNLKTNVHKLAFANSCKVRLCPCCAWRRSRKYAIENSKMLREINGNYIFLTVTIKNCNGEELPGALDMLNASWKRFYERKTIKSVMLGSVRNIEVTYNKRKKTYHPHMHVLMQVPASYYGKHYIKQNVWAETWKSAAYLDYNPIVDVRRVKNSKVYFEISKYVAKMANILDLEGHQLASVLKDLDIALYKRRTVSYTGTFRKWRQKNKLKDDIENKEEAYINDEEEWEILCYRWIYGEKRYRLEEIE